MAAVAGVAGAAMAAGVMTMAALDADEKRTRQTFARTRESFDEMRKAKIGGRDIDRMIEVAPAVAGVHADIEARPVESRRDDDHFFDHCVSGPGCASA